jgi:ABC-type uncharacterized transport system involved in gliding motility auxiliary subunit
VSGGVNGHIAQSFVQTSPRSWAETDIKAVLTTGQAKLEEARGDKPGPISIAAAVASPVAAPAPAPAPKPGETVNAPKPEVRVVVFGDSDFVTNSAIGIQGNRDLFMNALGWLSQQENLIAIRPNDPADRRITMTAAQQSNIAWLSLIIIPTCIFATGVYTWWRRR